MEYEKVSDTTGRVITPQPDKEQEFDVAEIKLEIERHNKDILFHQNEVNKLQEILNEFSKIGIDITDEIK